MLDRTLEPEVMDTLEEALAYDAMDHSEVNELFVNQLLQDSHCSGDVLDIGTGTARIPILLCKAVPDVRVWAVDQSLEMLDLARINVELVNLSDRIRLDQVDAKQLPYDKAFFGNVISNSIVHHIANPDAVFREALRVVRPGGHIFFRDLLRPHSDSELSSLVCQYVGQESEHGRQLFHDSLHAALTLREVQDILEQLGVSRQSVSQTSDRHWTWRIAVPD